MTDEMCTVEDCSRTGRLHGKWCRMHYQRWKKTGDPLIKGKPGRKPKPDSERFWPNVAQGTDGCWPWTATLHKGYGRFTSGGKDIAAYRWAYEELVGPVPEGLDLDHLCHTNDLTCSGGPTCLHRRCVNPYHLEPVPRGVNVLRGRSIQARNAVKTHCLKGHPFDEGNTVYQGGRRICYTCRLMRGRAAVDE